MPQNNFILEPAKNVAFKIAILVGPSDFFCHVCTGGSH